LSWFVFIDYKLESVIHFGCKKAEVLVENILKPHSLRLVLKNVGSCPFYFARVVSNKGNLKLCLVAFLYFDLERVTLSEVVDFYEDSDETFIAIADKLKEFISEVGLSGKQSVEHESHN
jgi:hypothetical protein